MARSCSACRLLFHHGAAVQVALGSAGSDILKLLSAIADHEMTATRQATSRPIHGAGTIRVYSIGPGDILIELGIEYDATTDVEDQACREAACAIERPQDHR